MRGFSFFLQSLLSLVVGHDFRESDYHCGVKRQDYGALSAAQAIN